MDNEQADGDDEGEDGEEETKEEEEQAEEEEEIEEEISDLELSSDNNEYGELIEESLQQFSLTLTKDQLENI